MHSHPANTATPDRFICPVQREVYAGRERLEQFTDRTGGGYERLLYVHEDLQGNTRYYTKENGNSFAELTYDAWGMPVSPNKLLNNDHGNYVYATYTGHIFDTTLDIYFCEARFYDASTRQWLAMDPIKDGENWYQYCYSSPIIYMDPNGLWVVGIGLEYAGAALVRGAVGAQIIIDDNGNVGMVGYIAAGAGITVKGSLSVTFSVTPNADTIYDLRGLSNGVGISGGEGISFGGDVSFGSTEDGRLITQYTGSIGLGVSPAPIEMHGQTIVAVSGTFGDMKDYIYNFLWDAFGEDLYNSFTRPVINYYFQKYGGCSLF